MIKLIIWDFNGTVIDDVDTSVAAVNDMLLARNLPPTNKAEYTRDLIMPLDKYYSTVGIHNADIPTLSIEFRQKCLENSHLSKIFPDFFPVVKFSAELGIKNVLMSSLYEEFLFDEIEKYNLKQYFDDIIGMKDTHVGSKYENAEKYIKRSGISVQNVLFLGDLISDYEIAKKLGANCILIPRGHTSKKRCIKCGATVCDSLLSIKKYLANN